jgi:hypothetical protein
MLLYQFNSNEIDLFIRTYLTVSFVIGSGIVAIGLLIYEIFQWLVSIGLTIKEIYEN